MKVTISQCIYCLRKRPEIIQSTRSLTAVKYYHETQIADKMIGFDRNCVTKDSSDYRVQNGTKYFKDVICEFEVARSIERSRVDSLGLEVGLHVGG